MHDKLQKTKQKLKDFRTKQKTATATDWKKITQTTNRQLVRSCTLIDLLVMTFFQNYICQIVNLT